MLFLLIWGNFLQTDIFYGQKIQSFFHQRTFNNSFRFQDNWPRSSIMEGQRVGERDKEKESAADQILPPFPPGEKLERRLIYIIL